MTLSKYRKIQIAIAVVFFIGVASLLLSVYMKPNPEFDIIEGKQVVLEGMSGETGRNNSVLSITTHGNPIDVLNVSGTLYNKVNGSLEPLAADFYSNLYLSIDYNETKQILVGTFNDGCVIISSYTSDLFPITEDTTINLYFSYHFPDITGCKCNRFYSTYVFIPKIRIGYIP